jgi:hypothetical protein
MRRRGEIVAKAAQRQRLRFWNCDLVEVVLSNVDAAILASYKGDVP